MPVDRILRINDRIRQVLSTAVYRIGTGEDVDTARLSFVSVSTAHDLRNATVLVSVMGDAAAHEAALRWVRRHRVDFQAAIAREMQLKYTPRLAFRLTDAIAQGDQVLDILENLDIPADPAEGSAPPCPPPASETTGA